MPNKPLLLILVIAALLISCKTQRTEPKTVLTGGPEVVGFRALQFPLDEVKLLDGPFRHAMDLDEKTLLGYEPDRLLAGYYIEAGLKPKAEKYHGWEDETIAGHSLGHYLSAISMMFRSSGDSSFLERERYIVSELKKLQEADGDGYLGAFPKGKKILSGEVAKGNIRAKGFDLNGIWVPYYTEHKMMAGLRDAYRLCSDTMALMVSKRFAHWLYNIVTPLNDSLIQVMLRCEHGGIAEVLADLYADTGDKKYLRMSELFYQKAVLDPLKNEKDILKGRHCNTNIPKLTGLSRLYELTGDSSDRKAAEFFWDRVVNHHSYATGGNGNKEYFGPADSLSNRLGPETTETCNVYNMLKLSEHLFEWKGDAKVADFYERALFNHILSSINPVNGRVTYNLSLEMGGKKEFQDPFDFTCCIGTGMETHSKYGRNIFYHGDNSLYLFQYISSELNWKEKGITVTQKTAYPEEQKSTLLFTMEKDQHFTVFVRYPYWAAKGFTIRVNRKKERISTLPGSFVAVERTWRPGDILEVEMPFSLRLEPMPDNSNRVAVMYGPLVLAGDLGAVSDSSSADSVAVPVMIVKDRNPEGWIKPVEGKKNTFRTINAGNPVDVELRPFYTIYDRRYSVYWDLKMK